MTASRSCIKPSCDAPATSSLSYRYGSQQVWLLALTPEAEPQLYDLCSDHADLLTVPRGWERVDHRPGASAAASLAADPSGEGDDSDDELQEAVATNRYAGLAAELSALAAEYAQPEEFTATGDTAGTGPSPVRLSVVDAGPSASVPAPSRDLAPTFGGPSAHGPAMARRGSGTDRGPGVVADGHGPDGPGSEDDDRAALQEAEDDGPDAVVVSLRAVLGARAARSDSADASEADDADEPDGAGDDPA